MLQIIAPKQVGTIRSDALIGGMACERSRYGAFSTSQQAAGRLEILGPARGIECASTMLLDHRSISLLWQPSPGARRLPLAFRTVGRAIQTDMKVPIMLQPRLNLAQPRAIVTRVTAERFFDRGVREYAIDARILSRGLNQRDVCRGPHFRVDILAVRGNDHHRHHLFPLFPRKLVCGHGREPDVDVKTDLMAGMSGNQRAATRLGHVADE